MITGSAFFPVPAFLIVTVAGLLVLFSVTSLNLTLLGVITSFSLTGVGVAVGVAVAVAV
jgi:hypothetical protein